MVKTAAKPAPKTAKPATKASVNVYDKLTAAFKRACPIVTLATSDPAQAVRKIAEALPEQPIILWDAARGATVPACQTAELKVAAASGIGGCDVEGVMGQDLATFLVGIEKLPKDTVVIVSNAHRFLHDIAVVQAVWNLRDQFKVLRRMLVLLGTAIRVPAELQHDVIELDEPLPDAEQLFDVAKSIADSAALTVDREQLEAVAAACQGMSAFGAEQLTALNASRANGISSTGVWADKCAKINEVPGLKVVSKGSFSDVAGVSQIKRFLTQVMTGKNKPNAVVWVEELDKVMGGNSSDSSGVSQDQLGVKLQWMQENNATGVILFGVPGSSKSAIAKATGGEFGIPTIQLDMGGMKGSLVGESETKVRDALKVIKAVSGGHTLWIATCNSMAQIPPELRRRYTYGVWMFDTPQAADRLAIWDLYCSKYDHELPDHDLLDLEWTGAEIETCCKIAYNASVLLTEASQYIVPVITSGKEQIESMRAYATGRLLSASSPGVYSKQLTENDWGHAGRSFDD